MEEKYVDLWWDAVHDIIQKDIGKVCKRYERIKRLYMHMISQMEKVMPTFEYELLVLSPKPGASNDKEDRGNTDGVGPLDTKTLEEETRDIKGGKNSPKREVGGETYASKQYL
jgi:hypothetical protein